MPEQTMEINESVAIIGDENFTAKLSGQPPNVPEGAAVTEVPVTVDKHGEIVGDVSHLDPHLLEQMSTPETKAQIAALWRKNKYGDKEPLPAPRYLTAPGQRRDFSQHGDRKTRRKLFRKMTKAARRSLQNEQSVH